ncbi:DUF3306 domain-containing protein [Moritella sp. 24]|uniref:DUF3306 domain-containing protein n=1 Tax=Moritella sp. 24 TaxID=2746230 RepID=UPI001BA8A396|nr:DUF3306 domain-containing protein [Moritella sp. 24]QUM75434.1 DUF3306 domain-containing protein [Moritella sp. 24]
MATNFFQRWSSRSLTAKDKASKELLDTNEAAVESLEPELIIEQVHESNSESNQVDGLSNDVTDDAVASDKDKQNGLADKSSDETLTIADADSVTFDSGVASFLQQGVDKSVKKAALAKLFHSDEFNYISDMDDHTEDFSNIPKLDDSVAKQLRGWVNKVLDEPEQDVALDQEIDRELNTELTEDPEIQTAETSVVEDEITEPVTEDFEHSPSADEVHHKTYQQDET